MVTYCLSRYKSVLLASHYIFEMCQGSIVKMYRLHLQIHGPKLFLFTFLFNRVAQAICNTLILNSQKNQFRIPLVSHLTACS